MCAASASSGVLGNRLPDHGDLTPVREGHRVMASGTQLPDIAMPEHHLAVLSLGILILKEVVLPHSLRVELSFHHRVEVPPDAVL